MHWFKIVFKKWSTTLVKASNKKNQIQHTCPIVFCPQEVNGTPMITLPLKSALSPTVCNVCGNEHVTSFLQ